VSRVVVIGGGLAGIAAALDLADAGAGVLLLEGRPRLGGATASFERDGLTVDTGQHVFLRCCTAYLGLLDRLGTRRHVRIQQRLDLPVVSPGGRVDHLTRSALPAPFHLAGALARFAPLPPADRARLVFALAALRRADPADPALDERGFAGWLDGHHQHRAAVENLWSLIALPTLNADPALASAALAAFVFRTALLAERSAADLGIPAQPLSRMHGEPAAQVLAAAGVEVALGHKVRGLQATGGTWQVRTDSGSERADAVVVAVPHQAAGALLPASAAAGGWATLGASPIVDLHLRYDAPVTDLPFAAGRASPVQWVFDRTAAAGCVSGQYLVVSLSAADRYIDTPVAELRSAFVPALAELFPAARAARLEQFFVTRERRATFRAAAGTVRFRPTARAGPPGSFLAGAWTATGWPDTMEGAVRSGKTGAAAALAYLSGRRTAVPA
jgi:squalene-associated FAD-dependent desaturase